MTSQQDTELTLDDAVRLFKQYVENDGDFDELDFKEWLINWRGKLVKEAKLKAKIKELHNVLNNPGTRAEPNGHKRRKRIKLLEKQLESLQSQGGKNETTIK